MYCIVGFFFFQAEDGIRDIGVTGVQTCALPISPLNLYPTQTLILSIPANVSILVTAKLVNPETLAAVFNITKSNHPHLLALPVVTPNSCPFCLIHSPMSSLSSVTNGPFPTLVV